MGQKSSKRRSSNARQLGCVFQDMKPPKSILRKCTDMRKPIQRVKFTKAIARHTKMRDQNPSLGYITPAVLSLGKLCDENGYSSEWVSGQKPDLIKNGIRIQCNTENFVPIVVPGLSTSSCSSSHLSTSMTLSRQERHCSTSSSSSSSSPTCNIK